MISKSRVAFYTQGCKLNFSETSTISRKFDENFFTKVDFNEIADVYVINTCSVTQNADNECKRIVRSALKKSPNAFKQGNIKPLKIVIRLSRSAGGELFVSL